MIRLHGNLELALWETGNKLSVYGYAIAREDSDGEDGGGMLQEVKDIAFSYIYVKNQVIKYVGEEYLNQSPLVNGTDSLQFLESDIFTSDDRFELVMTYAVSPWMEIPGVRSFRMANRYYGHIWNGYQIEGAASAGQELDIVYVAQNGVVYHEDRNCTHLLLTVRQVSTHQVAYERNANGGRYTPCEKCGKGPVPPTVYISVEGDRYHYAVDCSGLKRTVFSVTRQEAQEKYRPCSRCSGRRMFMPLEAYHEGWCERPSV